MARACAIGFVWIVLLGASGPALAPSWPPTRGVLVDAPAPCVPLAAIEIQLGCQQLTPSSVGTSFLDTDSLQSPQPIESAAEPLARGEELVAADGLARVPEPTSLLLLALGTSALGVASRMHSRGVERPR